MSEQRQRYNVKPNFPKQVENTVCCIDVLPPKTTPLGSNANKVASPDGQQVKPKPQRAKLNKIRREIKNRRLASERVCNCGYRAIGRYAELHLNPKFGSVKVGGVETCGSVWECPVCRTKIMTKRADELKAIGAGWRADGGQTAMVTLTIPHYKHQRLNAVLGQHKAKTGLSGAFYRLRQQRAWREIKKQIGYASDVRVYDTTNGKKNGWHTHIHLILYYKIDVDLNQLQTQIYSLWKNVCEMTGLGTPNAENGVKVTRGADEYLAKWGAPNELTSDSQKQAKNGNKTIAELENELLSGEAGEAEAILKEYYSVMRGRKLLTWAGENLRKRYLSEPDKTDDELAADQHGNGERLYVIEGKTWQQIYNTGEVGEMLTAVEADRENGLFGFLLKHKINPAGVRRTIRDFGGQSLPPPKPAKWGNYKWLN